MDTSELRQAITALRLVSEEQGLLQQSGSYLDDGLAALEESRTFTAFSKVANTSASLLDRLDGPPEVRRAVASLSTHCYQYCVDHSDGRADFTPSRNRLSELALSLGGLVTVPVALADLHEHLNVATQDDGSDASPNSSEPAGGAPEAETAGPEDTTKQRQTIFEEAVGKSVRQRLGEQILEWSGGSAKAPQNDQVSVFENRLRGLLAQAETGRQFGETRILDEDLAGIRPELAKLDVPARPQDIQERAKICRSIAAIDFRSADSEVFDASRRAWLLSAFWNSSLTEAWATNEEQFIHDALGYLTSLQAQYRYATHQEDVLLLLRVSHVLCRIASSDDLVPANFYEKFGAIESWVRYTVGTVLAISGPGRVPPSRLRNDPRLIEDGQEIDRDRFGAVLLPSWREPHEREAACAILLELAGWSLTGAKRLVRSALAGLTSESEVWTGALEDVVERAAQVKVLRPNPWATRSTSKLVTADTHALAVLASDVIHRSFPAIGRSITLNGSSFAERRVPTFVCSADFGPLGLFKADSRDRIDREATNFDHFAQRLHPRYRASRCDKSVAVISEPDDRIEFVGGLLTSYVFTEHEAPRTLNSWFLSQETAATSALLGELFTSALRPWYDHASRGVVDILAQYDLFTRPGLQRLKSSLAERDSIDYEGNSAINWIEEVVSWVGGDSENPSAVVRQQAADLQLCETFTSITHGDLHLDNVLVLGKDGAEYPCLIDFETTGESHMLRDLGRFVGAVLFRTYAWTPDEANALLSALPAASGLSSGSVPDHATDRTTKALSAIELVSASYRSQWRSGSGPTELELATVMICSFLPFARYPDTDPICARLALDISASIADEVIRI